MGVVLRLVSLSSCLTGSSFIISLSPTPSPSTLMFPCFSRRPPRARRAQSRAAARFPMPGAQLNTSLGLQRRDLARRAVVAGWRSTAFAQPPDSFFSSYLVHAQQYQISQRSHSFPCFSSLLSLCVPCPQFSVGFCCWTRSSPRLLPPPVCFNQSAHWTVYFLHFSPSARLRLCALRASPSTAWKAS